MTNFIETLEGINEKRHAKHLTECLTHKVCSKKKKKTKKQKQLFIIILQAGLNLLSAPYPPQSSPHCSPVSSDHEPGSSILHGTGS